MKIATWNVERLKHHKNLNEILAACKNVNADILVLTETDERVRPEYIYCFETPKAAEVQPNLYGLTENRVSIFTNYPCVQQHSTYDRYTALCVELETEIGNILVYGTIIGIYGNRHPNFMADLMKQTEDLKRLAGLADGLCVCGDFNCSLADNYYFTKTGRKEITRSFTENGLSILTERQLECIDHIAISERLLGRTAKIIVDEWNLDKKLSDHKGTAVTICR